MPRFSTPKNLLPVVALATLLASEALADNSGLGRATAGRAVVTDQIELIRGTWTFYALEEGGEVVKDSPFKRKLEDYCWTFDGETVRCPASYPETGSIKLEPDRSPPTMTVAVADTPTQTWLYELRGDTLRICYGPGGKLATTFDSKDGRHILTLKRVACRGIP